MALTKPILSSPIAAFDATQAYTFTFTSIGGSQVTGNTINIYNNTTGALVYTHTETTFRFENTIPAGSLTNGTNYNATVTTIDATGATSTPSIPVPFWCYTTPVLSFTNIPTGNIIPNASFNFAFSYTQAEGEALNSYILNLYTPSGTLISTSGTQYVVTGTPPYTGNFLFAGFENGTSYNIQISGTTINGTVVTSGLISITVKYTKPDIYTLMVLTNNCEGGYINIQSNFVLIEGTSNPSPPVYITDTEVDLTATGSWVEWNDGYTITGDMLTRIWFRSPTVNSTLLTFTNEAGQSIALAYNEGYVDNDRSTTKLAYMTATVSSVTGAEYFIYSGYTPILPATSYYNVWLTRTNDIYQLQFTAV